MTELLTPGVPQTSVSKSNLGSSKILLKPKPVSMISASSCGVLNSRFSGVISDNFINTRVFVNKWKIGHTAVNDARIVNVLESIDDGIN